MKTLLLALTLPGSVMAAHTFTLQSPKVGMWSEIPDSYGPNLDKEADRICDSVMGTKAKRLRDYSSVYVGPKYFITGDYACEKGPFIERTICGPFGGCTGNEPSDLDDAAAQRCVKAGYLQAERLSDYSYTEGGVIKVSAQYSCKGEN